MNNEKSVARVVPAPTSSEALSARPQKNTLTQGVTMEEA